MENVGGRHMLSTPITPGGRVAADQRPPSLSQEVICTMPRSDLERRKTQSLKQKGMTLGAELKEVGMKVAKWVDKYKVPIGIGLAAVGILLLATGIGGPVGILLLVSAVAIPGLAHLLVKHAKAQAESPGDAERHSQLVLANQNFEAGNLGALLPAPATVPFPHSPARQTTALGNSEDSRRPALGPSSLLDREREEGASPLRSTSSSGSTSIEGMFIAEERERPDQEISRRDSKSEADD